MPFIGVNCAAIPESLLESELFGYEEGAFTGASKKGKIGYFEQANHGTIFLDEIGDISPKLQARLLRVLQEKQVMRIGSDRVINVDVRIIAAPTGLKKEVENGNFRSDLYYRRILADNGASSQGKKRGYIAPVQRICKRRPCEDEPEGQGYAP